MKILFIAVLLITGMSAYAQEQRSGAIKTRDGFLIYFNYPENAFTLNVEGDADISKFPFIKTKGNYIQFQHAAKSEFGTTTPEVLTKYRKWEADYLKEMFGGKDIDVRSETIDRNGVTYSFWSHRTPLPENALAPDVTPVKRAYFLDFVHNGLVFRFSYASVSGDKKEALSILLDIAGQLTFYNEKIDLKKLQEAVMEGKTTYL